MQMSEDKYERLFTAEERAEHSAAHKRIRDADAAPTLLAALEAFPARAVMNPIATKWWIDVAKPAIAQAKGECKHERQIAASSNACLARMRAQQTASIIAEEEAAGVCQGCYGYPCECQPPPETEPCN